MKKETNTSLFFMMALGIVGLGFYFASADTYSTGEIELYHTICWIVLIVALIRMLEVIWRPLKELWFYLWERSQEDLLHEEKEKMRVPGRDRHVESDTSDIAEEVDVIIPSREVLTQDEMQTAIIVPESSQKVYVETVRGMESAHKESSGSKKKKKKKKK